MFAIRPASINSGLTRLVAKSPNRVRLALLDCDLPATSKGTVEAALTGASTLLLMAVCELRRTIDSYVRRAVRSHGLVGNKDSRRKESEIAGEIDVIVAVIAADCSRPDMCFPKSRLIVGRGVECRMQSAPGSSGTEYPNMFSAHS